MKNPLLSCLYLITKRQFCQNNTILWAKEVSRMPIFCDFSRKNYRSYAHILWKNVHSLKNTLLSSLYFIKKHQFCQNNTILWAKEVSRMPFFSDFSRKNYRSYAHILWKNVHSLKNTLLSSLYFVKKTSILSKTLCSYVIFSKFSWKTPCCQDHIWSKNVNSPGLLVYQILVNKRW